MTKDILGFRAIFGILGGFCDGGGEYLTGILQLLTDEFKLTFFPGAKLANHYLNQSVTPLTTPKPLNLVCFVCLFFIP